MTHRLNDIRQTPRLDAATGFNPDLAKEPQTLENLSSANDYVRKVFSWTAITKIAL